MGNYPTDLGKEGGGGDFLLVNFFQYTGYRLM